MKRILGPFALVIISAVSLSAQSATKSSDSPKATVDNFLTAVMKGDLLTVDAWQQANASFAHPSSMLHGESIFIIGADYSTQLAWVRGNHAEVVVTYRELGQIDPSLRYQPMASGRQITARYELIRMGVSDTIGTARLTGPRQWRIQSVQRGVWTGLPGAVRYVSEARANTNNSLITKNAERTLGQLNKVK